MFERNPEIRAGGKHFQPSAQVRIGVAQGLKWPPVQRAARRSSGDVLGELLFFENLVARFFGVERSIIKDGTQLCLGAALRQTRSVVFPRDHNRPRSTRSSNRKVRCAHVRRVVAKVGGQLPLRFAHFARIEKLLRRHRAPSMAAFTTA